MCRHQLRVYFVHNLPVFSFVSFVQPLVTLIKLNNLKKWLAKFLMKIIVQSFCKLHKAEILRAFWANIMGGKKDITFYGLIGLENADSAICKHCFQGVNLNLNRVDGLSSPPCQINSFSPKRRLNSTLAFEATGICILSQNWFMGIAIR